MTSRRWIADEVRDNRAALTGSHADHLARVLRARVGQEFDIATGDTVRRGRIVTIEPQRVEFELGAEVAAQAAPNVTLLLAVFKFDRMEWAIEKSTELGVNEVVPVIAQRTEPHLAVAAAKRVERWRRIALQAAEQSRRVRPAEIASPVRLKDAVKLAGATRIVLAESGTQVTLNNALRQALPGPDLLLAVGPEGGWTTVETELFLSQGWRAASLGANILRAETAAIAALAIAMAE